MMTFCVAIVLISLLPLSQAFSFDSSTILGEYFKVSGRTSACPVKMKFPTISTDGNVIMPADTISADGDSCSGTGGKVLVDGDNLRGKGLRLPDMVRNKDISFFAGVETNTRKCGAWAFNASAISWFVFNGGRQIVQDKATGLKLEPGFVYLTYEHFVDFCAYRAKVEGFEIEEEGMNVGTEGDEMGVANDTSISEEGVPVESAVQELENEGEPVEDEGDQVEDEGDVVVEEQTDEESVCFPGNGEVLLEDGRTITLRELKVGDRVLSSVHGEYSDVYMFSHSDRDVIHEFVKIETETGRSVSLTKGHFIYINDKTIRASSAKVGNFVTGTNGQQERIVSVSIVQEKGLYNPHTVHGDIIVNGVLVTTWTAVVSPRTAAALLSPFKMVHNFVLRGKSYAFSRWILRLIDFLRTANVQMYKFREL